MKIKLTVLLLSIAFIGLFAQTDSISFNNKIVDLNKKVSALESDLGIVNSDNVEIRKDNAILSNNFRSLRSDFTAYKVLSTRIIDSLENVIEINGANIESTANELGVKIENSEHATNQNISSLSDSLSKQTLYWVIVCLALTLFLVIIFVVLRKQIFKQKSDLILNIQNTRKNLEEEGVKLDNKLIEVLESQLKIMNSSISQTSAASEKSDHTLALKVADEIVRIEKNLSKMDENTKGIKPLEKGIERIKDNFKANGYEMVQLLGQDYNDGMNIDVINFIDDENLPSDKQVITRIIRPQVNYNNVLLQRAQVDVSQN